MRQATVTMMAFDGTRSQGVPFDDKDTYIALGNWDGRRIRVTTKYLDPDYLDPAKIDDSYRFRIFLDREDVKHKCFEADERHGLAKCYVCDEAQIYNLNRFGFVLTEEGDLRYEVLRGEVLIARAGGGSWGLPISYWPWDDGRRPRC